MHLLDVYSLQNIAVSKALGSYVWSDTGQKYLDMYGGHAVISIGHQHHHWKKAITDQLEHISFYSNSIKIPLQEKLAALLGEVSGKTNYQLFLCNSGAEANENALKLASFHTGRKKVVCFTGAFHGRTSLAVATTDNASISAPVNETDVILRLPFNDVTALQECFSRHGSEIACVITEGIQGVAGIFEASVPFLQAIRSLCSEYGAVYIADSVQCGYGRTGQFFAHDMAGVNADIYTLAKGMGNGFPVAGLICSPDFRPWKGMLGTTFGGNHLACAAAIAVLEVIQQENLITHAGTEGEYIMSKLRQLPGIQLVRGRGLMIGFEMASPENENIRQRLLGEKHVFTGEAKNNVVRLLPSLALCREEADLFLQALTSLLD